MKAFLLAVILCLALPALAQGAPKVKPKVRIDTSYGPFVVELEADLAPRTVANFLRYVKEGFYSDTIFHRVIEGFMVQGGGVLKDMTEKPCHEPIPNEAKATFGGGLKNLRGTLAMARTPIAPPPSSSSTPRTTPAWIPRTTPTPASATACSAGWFRAWRWWTRLKKCTRFCAMEWPMFRNTRCASSPPICCPESSTELANRRPRWDHVD